MKNNNQIKVSVLCMVYNHDKYLKKCLESIVQQQTNFEYEILVHDDCSTDQSIQIIKEYSKEYPNIIVPIYEKENQYSKGRKILLDILMPMMRGKYFAICEGDDYWIDSNKLQKQFDFMEKNREFTLCVHNAIKVNNNNKKIGKIQPVKKSKELNCKDFIMGGGGFVSTNSIFALSDLINNLPDYFKILTLDYTWQIFLSSQGKTYCFEEYMSAYRVGVQNSWTDRMRKNPEKYIKLLIRMKEMLEKFNALNNNKYDKVVQYKKNSIDLDILITSGDYEKIKQEPYCSIIKKKTLKQRLSYFKMIKLSKLYKIKEKI